MPPFSKELGTDPGGKEQAQEVAEDAALPETNTPSPSLSPQRTPSPPVEEEPFFNVQHIPQYYYFDMNPLPMMQDGVPDFLPVDHNLPQLLRRVTGTDDLATVQELKLRVISREMSLQRLCLYMPGLRELNLTGSSLGSLRDLGCQLRNLQVLKINRCGLESLDGTFGLTSVRELYAAHNKIDDVRTCTSLPHLRVLDLRSNLIHELGYVSFLTICEHFMSLTLADNPVATEPGYRADIIRMLPNLIVLDDIPINRQLEGEADLGFDEDYSDNDGNKGTERESEDISEIIKRSDRSQNAGDNYVYEMNRRNREHSNPSDSDTNELQDGSTSGSPVNDKELQPMTQMKQRPHSAAPYLMKSKNEESKCLAKQRPTTACPTARYKSTLKKSSSIAPDFRDDSPSILTSGDVVYGNLAAVLRRKKKRFSAWEEPKFQQDQKVHLQKMRNQLKQEMAELSEMMPNLCIKRESLENIKAELGLQEKNQPPGNENSSQEELEDPIEGSHRWRSLYSAYRSENRARWEKERLEDSISETSTSDKKLEAHRKIIKKVQEKSTATAPCCSAIFNPKMKNSGTCDPNAPAPTLDVEKKKVGKKGGKFPVKLY